MSKKPFKCTNCGGEKFKNIYRPKSVIECNNCHLKTLKPELLDTLVYKDEYYDTFSGKDSDLTIMWQKRLEIVQKYINKGRILDVGAGTGLFLSLAKKKFEVEGTEISKYARERAKSIYGVDMKVAVLEDLNKSGGYDVITAWHVLEHLKNPNQSIKKIADLLKDQGYFIFAVPNDDSLKQRIKKRFNFKTLYYDAAPSRENHIYFYTPEILRSILTQNGFQIKQILADDYYGKRTKLNSLRFKISQIFTNILPWEWASAIVIVAQKEPSK